MHTPRKLHDTQSQFCILHAALSWEADHGFVTGKGRDNLEVLVSPKWTFRSGPVPAPSAHLDLEEAAQYRSDLEAAVHRHNTARSSAETVCERIRSTVARFGLLGFWDYYAGQEGSIRLRLFAMADAADTAELMHRDLSDPQLRLFASYYIAYTDYVSE